MSAHTPGPWEVGELPEYGCAIVYADGIPIGDFGMDDDAHTNSANARLAAAAPELLAALAAHDLYMLDAGYSGPESDALHPKAAENWRNVRAAIAKATGPSPFHAVKP